MLVKTARHPQGDWQFTSLRNGFKRLDPVRGQEFILDLAGVDHQRLATYRLELVKPFSSAHLIQLQTHESRQSVVHFILPLTYNTSTATLGRFLASYEDCCLATKQQVTLFVVLYTGRNDYTQSLARDLQNLIMTQKSR